MDRPCSYEDLRDCLRSIAKVNRLTRAYEPTLDWLDQVYLTMPLQSGALHIVDVGCGFGDMLRRIHLWAADRNLPVVLTGIDVNPDAVRAAREATRPGIATFLTVDAFDFRSQSGVDIVVNSLMMHHLEDPEIVRLVGWMELHARLGWFINDLHRSRGSFYLVRFLALILPFHPFVRHDSWVSILRSFRKQDWERLLAAASVPPAGCTIRTSRPARLCVARVR